MSRKNIPSIITEFLSEIICSKCSCAIDVECVDPFTKVECPECRNIETVSAGFDHFTLLDLLGSGQMGSVYLAKDNTLNRSVAIKVMLPSLSEDENFVKTFTREAQALAQINHPNVAQIYSFGEKNGQQYLVMELVKGKKLQDMMQGDKKIDQALAMYIGLQVVKGLKVVGEAGLVHGDIKPENIVVDEKLNAKLVDFGLVVFDEDAPLDGAWGSPYYIAPEKLSPGKIDVRADIYSLGATLYHSIAGKPPFMGKTPSECARARLTRDPRDIAVCRRDINPSVRNIIMRMIERDPSRRYPNCASLMGDMVKVIKELGGVNKFSRPKVNIRPKTKSFSSSSVKSGVKTIASSSAKKSQTSSIAVSKKPAKSRNPLKVVMVSIFLVIGLVIFASVLMEKRRRARPSVPLTYEPVRHEDNDAAKRLAAWKKESRQELKQSSGTASVSTIVFTKGVSPDSSYKGVKDTFIISNPGELKKQKKWKIIGKFDRLFVGDCVVKKKGAPKVPAFTLIRWDISSIPKGSKIKEVDISLYVSADNSSEGLFLSDLKRGWDETRADWMRCTKNIKWGEPGAVSKSDMGSKALAYQSGVKKRAKNIFRLNKEGIAVVQNWVDRPDMNYGFRIGGAHNDGVEIFSSDNTDAKLRPQLIIKYSR